MFKEILKDIVEGIEGCVGGVLMGLDGIEIDSYIKEDKAKLDIVSLAMEFSVIASQVKNFSNLLEIENIDELSLYTSKSAIIIRMLKDDYFVAVGITPPGFVGKGRYILRINTPRLLKELE
jgi:predicted regulator of Ras-like GTPase activity (Roadblock/LC7/MglB family)